MLLVIEKILDKTEVARFRQALAHAEWEDGRKTGGTLGSKVKSNWQLDDFSHTSIELGNTLLKKLGNHPLFVSAAMPHKIYPPRFNRYGVGEFYGTHVDGSVMAINGTREVIRSDLSATIFLSEPEEYEGGVLMVETPFGAQEVKLEAGDMVLYPSSSLHQVTEVTAGERTCAILWLQSMVRDEGERSLLFDLDQSIQSLTTGRARNDPDLLRLTGVYHNLVRRWAEI